MVAQADRREGLVIQAIPIGFVAALVTAGLLLVIFLDNPYTGGNGSIKPTEMTRTLTRIDTGRPTTLRRSRQPYLAVCLVSALVGDVRWLATKSAAWSVRPLAGYRLCALLSPPAGEQIGSSGMHMSTVLPA